MVSQAADEGDRVSDLVSSTSRLPDLPFELSVSLVGHADGIASFCRERRLGGGFLGRWLGQSRPKFLHSSDIDGNGGSVLLL